MLTRRAGGILVLVRPAGDTLTFYGVLAMLSGRGQPVDERLPLFTTMPQVPLRMKGACAISCSVGPYAPNSATDTVSAVASSPTG
ncbi:MAG: hypothetical protein H6Q86_6063 [candidate division NC10 bacterium]|nr:hypothetical protein [candidate division NC10 bacterium]